jgi:hypothetical protein
MTRCVSLLVAFQPLDPGPGGPGGLFKDFGK